MFRIAAAASLDQQKSHVPIMDYYFGYTLLTIPVMGTLVVSCFENDHT